MADDGWETVTDPKELRAVLGGNGVGKSGLSGQENIEMRQARENNQAGRDIFHQLAQQYNVAKRYPGGIPQATYDKARLAVGSENQQAQDSDLFNAYGNKAALAKARLLAPVSNTDITFLKTTQASPRMRFENNKQLIGDEVSSASRAYFQNAFKQRWGARNGGLNGVDKQGHTYAEDLARAMKTPRVQNLMKAPWDRKGAGPVKIKGDADYEKLPSGATFIAPDGSTRRKP